LQRSRNTKKTPEKSLKVSTLKSSTKTLESTLTLDDKISESPISRHGIMAAIPQNERDDIEYRIDEMIDLANTFVKPENRSSLDDIFYQWRDNPGGGSVSSDEVYKEAAIAWFDRIGEYEPISRYETFVYQQEQLTAAMKKLEDFDKWAFLQAFFSKIEKIPGEISQERFEDFESIVKAVMASEFFPYYHPTGAKRLAFNYRLVTDDAVPDTLRQYANDETLSAEKIEFFAGMRNMLVPATLKSANFNAEAKFSRAQIIEALRKTGANPKLAAARLLRG
jgi:hypothetical protein